MVDRIVLGLCNMWISIFKTPQFTIQRNGMRRANFDKYTIVMISVLNEGK